MVAFWVPAIFAPLSAAEAPRIRELRLQARVAEEQGDWERALVAYESLLRLDRNLADVKTRYQHCLRRYWQVRRHRDLGYRKEVLGLEYGQAVRLYNIVLDTLLDSSLEKKKTSPVNLFRKGLEELRWALADPAFCQQHLPDARPEDIRHFRDFLNKTWGNMAIPGKAQAVKQMREIALTARSVLNLNTTTVVLEFTCGACYALDDYTAYLTPGQLRELCDSLKGEFVGVGLRLLQVDNRIYVDDVAPGSPAADLMPPLMKADAVVSIDRRPVANLSAEAAQEMLEGQAGTLVELVIESPGMPGRMVALRRRAQFMPSVAHHMLSETIGYVHIACFQETTLQELDVALLALGKADMKALILDLRGNGGGLFDSAIQAARRFLPTGVIVSTEHQDSRDNMVYHARNPGALTLPLVVLIDGDTASAAEVLAGALKDNKRGRLVGQTTFGKGCTQCLLKLPPAPGGVPTGGLRVTVTRFFSPSGLPYTGRGVLPHLFVDRVTVESMSPLDAQLEEARIEVLRLLEIR
jgi:carboxyl-terminal processing protease